MLYSVVNLIAGLFTIAASGLALYLYFFRRDTLRSIIRVLANYGLQVTANEVRAKLDRLNELSAEDGDDLKEIVNLLNEIEGQVKGNAVLRQKLQPVLRRLTELIAKPSRITEPRKRSLVSELREEVRHLSLNEYTKLLGDRR